MSVELECACLEGAPESSDELAAEDTAEHLDGQEEGAAGKYPTGTIRRETTSGDYAVDMGMMLQSLIPGMEHAEEADPSAKMPWITSDLKQGVSAGVKEQVVDEPLVLQGERSQLSRQSEDGMYIAGGQQFPFTRLEPAQARVALAPRAMAISARVV
jgi:hypothetical protein